MAMEADNTTHHVHHNDILSVGVSLDIDSFLSSHLSQLDRVVSEVELNYSTLMSEIDSSLSFVSVRRKQRLRALSVSGVSNHASSSSSSTSATYARTAFPRIACALSTRRDRTAFGKHTDDSDDVHLFGQTNKRDVSPTTTLAPPAFVADAHEDENEHDEHNLMPAPPVPTPRLSQKEAAGAIQEAYRAHRRRRKLERARISLERRVKGTQKRLAMHEWLREARRRASVREKLQARRSKMRRAKTPGDDANFALVLADVRRDEGPFAFAAAWHAYALRAQVLTAWVRITLEEINV